MKKSFSASLVLDRGFPIYVFFSEQKYDLRSHGGSLSFFTTVRESVGLDSFLRF